MHFIGESCRVSDQRLLSKAGLSEGTWVISVTQTKSILLEVVWRLFKEEDISSEA